MSNVFSINTVIRSINDSTIIQTRCVIVAFTTNPITCDPSPFGTPQQSAQAELSPFGIPQSSKQVELYTPQTPHSSKTLHEPSSRCRSLNYMLFHQYILSKNYHPHHTLHTHHLVNRNRHLLLQQDCSYKQCNQYNLREQEIQGSMPYHSILATVHSLFRLAKHFQQSVDLNFQFLAAELSKWPQHSSHQQAE